MNTCVMCRHASRVSGAANTDARGHCFCRLFRVLCGGVTEWVIVVAVLLVVVVEILMYNVSLTHTFM